MGLQIRHIIWAVTWQNQQNECVPSELISAPAQSDQSSLSAWRKLGSLATHWAHSEYSDQTGWMSRLIWVFAGRTHFVGFVVSWLIYLLRYPARPNCNARQILFNSSKGNKTKQKKNYIYCTTFITKLYIWAYKMIIHLRTIAIMNPLNEWISEFTLTESLCVNFALNQKDCLAKKVGSE